MKARLTVAIVVVTFLCSNFSHADYGLGMPVMPEAGGAAGSEFVSGNSPGAVLMDVNLWGSIRKPGIHHIPSDTDLITLLSYAGGPDSDADLTDVYIKRKAGGEQVISVNAEKLLRSPKSKNIILQPNDIIVVPRNESFVSQNTMTTVGFVGSLLGIVVTSFALSTIISK